MRLNSLCTAIHLSIYGETDLVALKRYEEYVRFNFMAWMLGVRIEDLSYAAGLYTTAAK